MTSFAQNQQMSPHSTARGQDKAHKLSAAERDVGDDTQFRGNQPYQEIIIHRSADAIIVANPQRTTELDPNKKKLRGYNAPENKPYKNFTMGKPENVLPVIQGLKSCIEHSAEMMAETQKVIQRVQRYENPMFFQGGQPNRTLRIMNQGLENSGQNRQNNSGQGRKKGKQKFNLAADHIDIIALGEGDAQSIMKRMKMIEDQFMSNPSLHDPAHQFQRKPKDSQGKEGDGENDEDSKVEHEQFSNQRLLTPRMRKLMSNKDAREVLQEEVNESVLRLKKAKFGHQLNNIVPDHKNKFYLPNKSDYIQKEKSQGRMNGGSSNYTNSKPNLKNAGSQMKIMKSSKQQSPQIQHRRQMSNSIHEQDIVSSFITEPPAMLNQTYNRKNESSVHNTRFGASPAQTNGLQVSMIKGNGPINSQMRHSNMQSTTCDTQPSAMKPMNAFQQKAFGNSRLTDYNPYGQGGALSSAGNQMVNTNNRQSFMTMNQSVQYGVPRGQQSIGPSQTGDKIFYNTQTNRRGNTTTFKQVWRKAIEKYSPKKAEKLNEVSWRFEQKLKEIAASNKQNKIVKDDDFNGSTVTKGRIGLDEDEQEQIKFVSMIDQKPIKPSYLELVPMKDFSRKEQKAVKEQFKDNNKQETNETKQGGIKSINWQEMLEKDLESQIKDIEKQIVSCQKKRERDIEQIVKMRKKIQGKDGMSAAEMEHIQKEEEEAHENPDRQKVLAYKENLLKMKLTPHQTILLKKLVDTSMRQYYDTESTNHDLYKLFFDDQSKDHIKVEKKDGDESGKYDNENVENDAECSINRDEAKLKAQKRLEEEREEKKRKQLKLDGDLIEFEDRGGFAQVLKDIFNPTDQSSMELDSVYQLKQLCKAFYQKKAGLSQSLIQCLDALANERPWTVKMKKKHFDTSSNNLLTDIEYMRINAERERIKKYQTITKSSAYTYYKILKRLTVEGAKSTKEEMAKNGILDPQAKIQLALRDAKIQKLTYYITDFIKQVVENGNEFTKEHFFMLLETLDPSEVKETIVIIALRIIIEEIEISSVEYVEFNQSIKNNDLHRAYFDIRTKLFPEDS